MFCRPSYTIWFLPLSLPSSRPATPLTAQHRAVLTLRALSQSSGRMGNCVCMQGPGRGSRSNKRVISGGGDSVKPFLDKTATIHPLAADDSNGYQKAAASADDQSKVVRLKVVLTKTEVAQLLASGTIVATMSAKKMSPGASLLEQLTAELQGLSSADQVQRQQIGCGSCAWKPGLESIPEVM